MSSVDATGSGKLRGPSRILQLNLHRLEQVMHSLFNSPVILKFDLSLIQKPNLICLLLT